MKKFIERIFAGAVDVFVSTHEWSLQPGDLWESKIRKELKNSKMILVLLSKDSITRPWINFEAGAAWLKGIILIPMMHRGFTSADFIPPYISPLSISLLDPHDIDRLIKRIAIESGLNPVVSDDQYFHLVQEISSLDRQIDEDIARQCLPKQARSKVRFYLYSKSRVQYRQNLLETAGNEISCFRKPDLFEVFKTLADFGQPDITVFSLDEYWVKEFAKTGRLEELSDFTKTHIFFDELMYSSIHECKHWSVPHFIDFSYYACHRIQWNMLRSWLDDLLISRDFVAHFAKLRKSMGTDRLLLYDFHTPDTCACVILEFIVSFGDGLESLQSRAKVSSERNKRALRILRGMVGECPESDFLRGEPLNFDPEYEKVPFLRGWHSRMSDMPTSRETHAAIRDCPIVATLGGWHIGILARAPSMADGLQSLAGLITKKNQQERLRLGAGLPTLAEFYRVADLARQQDPITHWSLAEIGTYVKTLIRRSNIPSYPMLRVKLSNLHDQIMTAAESETEEVLFQWASQLSEC